ncbi:MAG: nucleotidyltransferase domain-containing protein [Gemmatimonadaceae bacterium]|nr:nucleotidyltransferase domain-containing protein [Gemmatimonadaceae bacterium]
MQRFPHERDLRVAKELSRRIVECGGGKVRRVVMFGSRAVGGAHDSSDLDLIVVVEIPYDPSGGVRECNEIRAHIVRTLGLPPLKTDLSVRSIDQFEAAKGVIGGAERLAVTEGVELFCAPYTRAPVLPPSQQGTIAGIVRSWFESALKFAEDSATFEAANDSTSVLAAFRSIQKSITAVCVHHQMETSKAEPINQVLQRLTEIDEEAANAFRSALGCTAMSFNLADRVLRVALSLLIRDELTARYLRRWEHFALHETGAGG